MSNVLDLQDALLKAVDSLTQNRIDKLQLDKTITATIIKCTNALIREYKCSYNGGTITCYAKEGETYTNGQNVYVLIPQSDMTQKKIILSLESAQEDDGNISFVSSALSDYNLIGKNVIQDKYKIQPVGLHSYLKEEYRLLYQHGLKQIGDNPLPNMLQVNIDELNNNLKEAEAIMIEASFQTRLPKVHRYATKGVYGLQFVLAYADRDKFDAEGNPAIKHLSYTIDSNNMTGNPFNFLSWSEQYQIYPIDIENFLYIDSILFFEKDFVEKSDKILADEWGSDIFLKDIEFYGLKKITGVNGNYRLNISTPLGNTLYSLTSSDKIEVNAKFTEKGANLSDNTTFYWFKEDNRVTSTSENYQMYGGAGWARLKEKGINYHIELFGNENRAYENKYLCVAVYKEQVILKEYFTIYNESAKRALSITSSLGIKFSFDRGIPTLTCLIDGKETGFEANKVNPHPDKYFKFVWSKIDQFGNVTIFNETKEELQKRYDQLIASGEFSYSDLSTIRNQIQSLENVSWDRNKLTYAVNHIDTQAKFKCAVYLRDREPQGQETIETIEYNIGSAEIVLQNEGAATPTDYYIMIENGDQVFQYSESGVSPDDDRYKDPLEIKPLICHFYDPAGIEVNNKTYDVKWVVPLTDSMIVVPKENMILNHANNKIEWYTEEIFPLAIDADYDYQALNNQLTAIITYQGQEYQQDTNLLFTKVGENGTNGTDIVTKISPLLKTSNNNALAIVEGDYDAAGVQVAAPKYNDTKNSPLTVKPLDFNLYQRNEKLSVSASDVKWTVSGVSSQSRQLTVNSNGTLGWSNAQKNKRYRYQIIKGSTVWEGNDYYAFYQMPVIDYYNNNSAPFTVNIKNNTLLKSITYNADGRNPLYNKNQGVELELTQGSNVLTNYYIVWTAEGGEPNLLSQNNFNGNPASAAFTLIKDKNAANGSQKLIPDVLRDENNNIIGDEFLNKIYILPDDVYSGEYTNNIVHAAIYANKQIYQNNGNAIAHVYVPIYMSLNTYGLKSLNAWDGNHIDINQDDNYILAPQIGAGVKDKENKFTGIVMGSAKTYDQKEPTVGLLGYSAGKQSILLNSKDGSAIFGLPEQQATANNHYTEGRIELIPGGESKIGQWRIGSRAIYNMTKPMENADSYIGVEPNPPYKDYRVSGAQISVPEAAQGIILNANPAYGSFKGKPLTKTNSKIDFDNANCAIKEGDSFEVEIDPAKDSAFSIYRHTQFTGTTKGEWRRYPLVGINSAGQFYTNAIENQESSMGIGKIGAFGLTAADGAYVGAQFAYNGNNILKFFVPKGDNGSNTLYLSAGSRTTNEYNRSLSMHFKTFSLFASDISTLDSSPYLLQLSSSALTMGYQGHSLFIIPFGGDTTTSLDVENNILIRSLENRNLRLTLGGNEILINPSGTKDLRETIAGVFRQTSQSVSLTIANEYRASTPQWKAVLKPDMIYIGKSAPEDRDYLSINPSTKTELVSGTGLDIINKGTKPINIVNQNAADGMLIDSRIGNNSTKGNARIRLIPRSDGYSSFTIESGRGAISSVNNINNSYQGVTISDGVGTKWLQLTGSIPWSNTRGLIANNGIQGSQFYFNSSLNGSSVFGGLNSVSVRDHLVKLYALFAEAKKWATTEANRGRDEAKSWTADQGYATTTWVTNNFAKADHTHNYASSTHTHEVSLTNVSLVDHIDWDTYEVMGMDVSHVKKVETSLHKEVKSSTTSEPQ